MKVEMLDNMGTDASVVRAARVSYGKETKGPVADALLIDFLIRNGHTSPFAHVVFSFRLQVPIFVARQLMRHHVGIAWNEISGRYTKLGDYYVPHLYRFDGNDKSYSPTAQKVYENSVESAIRAYEHLLESGVPREVARGVLPLATYTTLIMTANLRALLNMFEQRLTLHAQEETRDVVHEIFDAIHDKVPISMKSFTYWKLDDKRVRTLSTLEQHFHDITGGKATEEDWQRYLKRIGEEGALQ